MRERTGGVSDGAPLLFRFLPDYVVASGRHTRYAPGRAEEIAFLHIELNAWIGVELFVCESAYVVTDALTQALASAGVQGFSLRKMRVERTENMLARQRGLRLPPLHQLVPEGRATFTETGDLIAWSGHDLCLSELVRPDGSPSPRRAMYTTGLLSPGVLVVTQRCLLTLLEHGNCQATLGGLRTPGGAAC